MAKPAAPAETYLLNTLASAVGRYGMSEMTERTARQSEELVDAALLEIRESDAPPVPHTEPALLEEAIVFDRRLRRQLTDGPARDLLRRDQISESLEILDCHWGYCERALVGRAGPEAAVRRGDIAEAYGLPDMWSLAEDTLVGELAQWGHDTKHPAVPPALQAGVSGRETRRLVHFLWGEVIGSRDHLLADIYLTGRAEMYHLYWAPTAEGLDYATPSRYDRATQLSFDLPHNVAHLAHLTALGETEGAHRYRDGMAERAYFEAVAVLSEYAMTEILARNPDVSAKLAEFMELDTAEMTPQELSDWLIADRRYEFKLRAARLYADMLMLDGWPYQEAVGKIANHLGIPESDAAAETRKYLPWTGLGAVYTLGYRRLLAEGIDSVPDAIRPGSDIITTWEKFEQR